MLSAFGVDDSRIAKAKKLTDEQKRTAAGVGAAGTAVYGYQAGTSLKARNAAQHLAHPDTARGVAETLGRHHGQAMNLTLHGLKAQRVAHDAARQAHPDVKRVRDSADRWSSTFGQVKRIRRAYDKDAPVPGVARTLVRPIKAKAESDSNVMRHLDNARSKSPTLYRGMRTDQHSYKVGDHVDFHDLTSWSSDHDVAHLYSQRNAKKGGAHAHVFEREPGHGTSLEAASPQFQQREWVAGGRHRVVGHSPSGAIRVARILKSAFGVDDTRISKWVDENGLERYTRAEARRRGRVATGVIAGAGAAAGAALGRGKLKPTAIRAAIGGTALGGASALNRNVLAPRSQKRRRREYRELHPQS